MKKITLFVCLTLFSFVLQANNVIFGFQDHTVISRSGQVLPQAKVGQIEKNISTLLTAIDDASRANKAPVLQNVQMTADARKLLTDMWRYIHLACDKTAYESTAICDADGYQVRGVSVTVDVPSGVYKGDKRKELLICFNNSGVITDVKTAMPSHAVSRLMEDMSSVKDEERRYTIIKFVENFRQCYERKDIESLRTIFSDDALIITGRVVKVKVNNGSDLKLGGGKVKEKIVYSKQDKDKYLNNLSRKFNSVKYINVDFDYDKIEIEQCGVPGKESFYGVSIPQHWSDSNYEDDGYLFLLWEFDESGQEPPTVHVRTWQPMQVDGRNLTNRERVDMHDYKF